MTSQPAAPAKGAHTPGPWTVNGFGGDFRVIARMQPHEVAVSAKAEGGDEMANACLMAASPSLLEAAQEAYLHMLRMNDVWARATRGYQATLCSLRDSIAAATDLGAEVIQNEYEARAFEISRALGER